MRITINSGEIPRGAVKCVTYDNTSNPSKLIFSMKDKESAQRMFLAVTNLQGLIGNHNRLFKCPFLSESVFNDKEVWLVIRENKVDEAVNFLRNIGIITADVGRIVLKKVNEGQEIENISIVEVTSQS